MKFTNQLTPNDWAKIELFAEEVRAKMQNCSIRIANYKSNDFFAPLRLVATVNMHGFSYGQPFEFQAIAQPGYAEYIAKSIAIELGMGLFFRDGQSCTRTKDK